MRGFTIIETSIYLAVSSLLIFSFMSYAMFVVRISADTINIAESNTEAALLIAMINSELYIGQKPTLSPSTYFTISSSTIDTQSVNITSFQDIQIQFSIGKTEFFANRYVPQTR